MMRDYFSAEYVESYLSGELTSEEIQLFDQKLQNDPEFSAFFSLFQDVDLAIAEQDVIELRQELQSIHDVAAEEWVDEAPMLLTDTYEKEIDNAIGEQDVMMLRSMLNDIHDLNTDDLHSAETIAVPEPIVANDSDSINIAHDLENLEVDMLENDIFKAIMEDDVMELRDKLQDIGKEITPAKKSKPWYNSLSRITAAASIFLLLILGGTFLVAMNGQPIKPDKAIKIYFNAESFDYNAPQRGTSNVDEYEKAIANASALFREGEYLSAYYVIEAMEEKRDEENWMPIAYSGMCLFYLDRFDEAAIRFDQIIGDGDNSYIEDAQWFAAGCMLKTQEDENTTISYLRELALLPEHDHSQDIKKLLKGLTK